ncbi:Protein kinase-like protein [Apiospora hydei]|uniref:Protein kinase-like protein n=1 Tax=Apiospora hydei TaxID=1337664 RepID=A0ABR1VZP1_9PEZI
MERLSDPLTGWRAKCAKEAFLERINRAEQDIVTFVNTCLRWDRAGEFVKCHVGSLNVGISVQNSRTQEHVLIRFPIPGTVHLPCPEPWLEQRVKGEVMVLKYLGRHTKIPVPRVYHWGTAKESPKSLGPFIIEEYMKGENLGDILKARTNGEKDHPILDPDIDETKLDFVYEQIAGYQLQLSRLKLPSIGAISSITSSGDCKIAGPPLTYDMNTVASFTGFHDGYFTFPATTTGTPKRAKDYFVERARCLQAALETHCSDWREDENIAWKRYVARQCLEKLVPTYCAPDGEYGDASGSFRLFCDGLGPSNMLADPKTMRITAVLDLGFTNALPAQYIYDVSSWLVLGDPAILANKMGKKRFLELFEPRKEQYIRAMERAEAASPSSPPKATGGGAKQEPRLRLSSRMRVSWDSGRFWLNLASRSCRDADDIYWRFLHREGRGCRCWTRPRLRSGSI